MTKSTAIRLFITIAIIAIAMLLLMAMTSQAGAAGCTPQAAVTAADTALQAIRYGWPGQAAKVDHAIAVAHRAKAPARFVRRLLLAKRYLKRHPDLSRYHLWMAVSHVCY